MRDEKDAACASVDAAGQGRAFSSFTRLAQREERLPYKQRVGGSNPSPGTNVGAIAQLGERLLCKQRVVGSNPTGSTKF